MDESWEWGVEWGGMSGMILGIWMIDDDMIGRKLSKNVDGVVDGRRKRKKRWDMIGQHAPFFSVEEVELLTSRL